jgi:tetratricopeptide (TPR) repeat protein
LGYIGLKNQQLTLARDLIYRFPDKASVIYLYSRVALKSNQVDDATKYANIVYKLSPNHPEVIIHYANCLLASGNEKLSDEIVNKACTVFPNNQHLKAIQTTLWRLREDPRYELYCNYDKLVVQSELCTPKGWDSLESYISDLEAELNEAHKFKSHPFGQSVRDGSQIAFINKSKSRALQAYGYALIETVRNYLEDTISSGKAAELNPTIIGAWSVKLFKSGCHESHVHQDGWLSSVCHLRFPSTVNSTKEGWLKVGEPGMTTEKKLCAEKYIKPKRGQVVIFPSYIWHGTVPINGDFERLSIAADIGSDTI